MTLAPPSPSAAPQPQPQPQPLQLPWDLRLSADQFERVCQANPDAVLELAADGHLIAMTPTGSETGARNQALGALLWLAVRRSGLPLQAFDSSSDCCLPDGSVLRPSARIWWGNELAPVWDVPLPNRSCRISTWAIIPTRDSSRDNASLSGQWGAMAPHAVRYRDIIPWRAGDQRLGDASNPCIS
jgi:hypothetical protein